MSLRVLESGPSSFYSSVLKGKYVLIQPISPTKNCDSQEKESLANFHLENGNIFGLSFVCMGFGFAALQLEGAMQRLSENPSQLANLSKFGISQASIELMSLTRLRYCPELTR